MEDIQRNIKQVDERISTLIELKNEALLQDDLASAAEYKEEITKLQKQRDQLSRELRKEAASMIASEIESMAQGVLGVKSPSTTEESSDLIAQIPKKPLPVPPKKKTSLPPAEVEAGQLLEQHPTMDDLDKQIEDILQMVSVTSHPEPNHKRAEPAEPLPEMKIEDATNFEELLNCLDVAWKDLDKLSQRRNHLEHQVTALVSFLQDMGQQIDHYDVTACS